MIGHMELSIVMPCLNEEETLGACIEKCQRILKEHRIDGEVIVADNGSTDSSVKVAEALGARVVHVPARGYGNALRTGIREARGTYVIMGDADRSYDFGDVPKFLEKLRKGNDLVLGCRLPAGGGTVMPHAMPPLHRTIGNPLLSLLVRWWFRAPTHDVYCGMRGFCKALFDRLDLRCQGMEFATEMVIKASLFRAKIAEVPITLHRDGRKKRKPHLRTFHDGWRTLHFFLIYSPRWLFLVPGAFLFLTGGVGYALALPGTVVFGARLDAHTLLFSSLFLMLGYQAMQFGVLAKTFAIAEGLLPKDRQWSVLRKVLTLDRGLLLGIIAMLAGFILLGLSFREWQLTGFGDLNYAETMRIVVPGVTLSALGVQTVLACFFLSLLNFPRS